MIQYLVGIFILSLALRIFWVLLFQDPVSGDPLWYHKTAIALLEYKDYVKSPFNEPTAWRLPGYTLVLAVLYFIFDESIVLAGIFNAILGSTIALLIYCLARFYLSKKLSLLCSLIYCLWPSSIIVYVSNLYVESIYTFMVVCVLIWTAALYKNTNIKNLIILSIIIGISIYFRPTLILYPCLLFILLLFNNTNIYKNIFYSSLVIVIIAIILSPWIIRNYIVFDDFILTGTYGGYNLAIANGSSLGTAGFNAHYPHGVVKTYMFNGVERNYNPEQYELYWHKNGLKLALNHIRDNPKEWLTKKPKAIYYLWNYDISLLDLHMFIAINNFSRFQKVSMTLAINLYYYIVLIIVLLCGIFVLIKYNIKKLLYSKIMILLLLLLYWNIFHLMLFGASRHHAAVIPLLIILFVYFINETYQYICNNKVQS